MFLLTAILSIAMVSASVNFTVSPTSLNFINSDLSETLTLTSTVATTYQFVFPTINDEDGTAIPFTAIANKEVTAGTATPVNVISTLDYDNLMVGETYTGNLAVTDINDSTNTISVPITFTKTFCDSGEKGNDSDGKLEITDVSIDNDDGDDTEWSPLDTIQIEVEVENTGDDKLGDVIVEIGLYNSKGKNIVGDLKDLDDEQIDLGSIKSEDDETATFDFQVPADFSDENYVLVIKVYSDDEGEENVCTSYSADFDGYYETIEGARETDEENHIVVDNIEVSPSNPQCSEQVQVSAEVFNIGDEDYEDQVKVTLTNKELGLNLEQIIRQDFDQGDSETIEFEFEIPATATKKVYVLEFRTYYDYDDDAYELVSSDRFTKTLTVEGNCGEVATTPSIEISAKLSSDTPEAIAGEQVIIQTTLKNTGTTTGLYTISVSGNSAWSSLNEIDSESVVIPAGESKEVSIILDIDAEAEGDKEFTIKATKDGVSKEQKVALSITGKTTSSSPILDHIKANGFIYAIVIINLILIIAIILVIRRMVSKA